MYTILVTGSKGQLGSEIADLKGQFSECTFFLTDKEELDITNETQIEEFVIKNNINAIINCAAYTSVDKAEDDKELAYKIKGIKGGKLTFEKAKAMPLFNLKRMARKITRTV